MRRAGRARAEERRARAWRVTVRMWSNRTGPAMRCSQFICQIQVKHEPTMSWKVSPLTKHDACPRREGSAQERVASVSSGLRRESRAARTSIKPRHHDADINCACFSNCLTKQVRARELLSAQCAGERAGASHLSYRVAPILLPVILPSILCDPVFLTQPFLAHPERHRSPPKHLVIGCRGMDRRAELLDVIHDALGCRVSSDGAGVSDKS